MSEAVRIDRKASRRPLALRKLNEISATLEDLRVAYRFAPLHSRARPAITRAANRLKQLATSIAENQPVDREATAV